MALELNCLNAPLPQQQLKFLGCIISGDGVAMNPKKIQDVQ